MVVDEFKYVHAHTHTYIYILYIYIYIIHIYKYIYGKLMEIWLDVTSKMWKVSGKLSFKK